MVFKLNAVQYVVNGTIPTLSGYECIEKSNELWHVGLFIDS